MVATVLPNRSLLNLSVQAALAAATGFKVGFGAPPALAAGDFDDEGALISPYTIVYARPGMPEHENWDRSACMAEYPYQFTAVGQTDEQAQFMADLNRQALLLRAANGDLAHPLSSADARVLSLYSTELGGPEPGGGGLRQVVDIFNLEVESIG
jgi:hypothetical protein